MDPLRRGAVEAAFFALLFSCSPKLEDEEFAAARAALVARLAAKEISSRPVLKAIGDVPRHLFVHPKLRALAYEDHPLSIGYDQTISAPSMTARMLEIANPHPDEKVLEIRTGSGYETALLAKLAKEVSTVEIVRPVAEAAQKRLRDMGCGNIFFKIGELAEGWKEKGPFDLIVAAAAAADVPQALLDQLAPGGRMILPVGELEQELVLVKKTPAGIVRENYGPVRFMPMLRERDLTPAQKGERGRGAKTFPEQISREKDF